MTIIELNTPLEKKRMIQYGADGNKVVRHWYNVRRAIGNVWVSEPEKDEYGRVELDVFLSIPGGDGLKLGSIGGLDWRTVDALNEFNQTLEEIYAFMDERIKAGRFIGNAQIEFVRQFDADRAAAYAAYREEYYKRREAEEQYRQAQREAEEAKRAAEEAVKKEAEDKAARALYHGFADSMTAMRFGKVDSTLSKLIREDGKITSKRQWVEDKVSEGWNPEQKNGVTSWYGSRWDRKESKPRTEYKLEKDNLCYTINKTEYEYAVFLAGKIA